jgi:hypothetical protein
VGRNLLPRLCVIAALAAAGGAGGVGGVRPVAPARGDPGPRTRASGPPHRRGDGDRRRADLRRGSGAAAGVRGACVWSFATGERVRQVIEGTLGELGVSVDVDAVTSRVLRLGRSDDMLTPAGISRAGPTRRARRSPRAAHRPPAIIDPGPRSLQGRPRFAGYRRGPSRPRKHEIVPSTTGAALDPTGAGGTVARAAVDGRARRDRAPLRSRRSHRDPRLARAHRHLARAGVLRDVLLAPRVTRAPGPATSRSPPPTSTASSSSRARRSASTRSSVPHRGERISSTPSRS